MIYSFILFDTEQNAYLIESNEKPSIKQINLNLYQPIKSIFCSKTSEITTICKNNEIYSLFQSFNMSNLFDISIHSIVSLYFYDNSLLIITFENKTIFLHIKGNDSIEFLDSFPDLENNSKTIGFERTLKARQNW